MNVFELFAKLSLDDSEYNEGLDNAKKSASGVGKAIGTGLKAGGAAIAAVGAATVAMTGAFIKSADNVAEYGDNIDKMSQKLGISAEAYQEWDAVMQHSGTTIDGMQRGMVTLQSVAEKDAAAFEALGISQEQLASMNTEEMFSAVISGLQGMEEGSERTVLAQKLLGSAAKELGPLLNTSAEETQAMKDRVHELGGVMSDEAVKAAAKFKDSQQDLNTAFNSLSRNMTTKFLPSITGVMDGLAKVFTGEGGLDDIKQGISDFVGNLTEELPKLLTVGSGIVTSLLTAIEENLPELAGAAVDTIIMLATYLIENLPLLVDSALTIIMTLADGLVAALPELIPAIVDVILKIVDTLTDPDNISNLIDAAIAIIMALAEGLIEALPKLAEKAPEIIMNLVEAIIENLPKLLIATGKIIWQLIKGIGESVYRLGAAAWDIIKELGAAIVEKAKDLWNKAKEIVDQVGEGIAHWAIDLYEKGKAIVDGVWEGISSKFLEFKQKVTDFFGGIVNSVKEFLGIASPSKVFASIGDMMAAGLEKGFDDGMTDAERTMSRDMEDMVDALSGRTVQFGNIDFASSGLGKSSAALMNGLATSGQLGGNLSVQVVLQDGTEVARAWLPDFLRVASSNGTPLTA